MLMQKTRIRVCLLRVCVVSEDRTDVITEALQMISDKTCVKFHLQTTETDYLYFFYSKG